MSKGFVFSLVTIVCGLTSFHLVNGLSYSLVDVTVSMPPPSPPLTDNDNITYVHDDFGHFHKVDIKQVEDEPASYFSVENDVIFELFTQNNPTEPQILQLNNYTSVRNSNFNRWHPTRILIHGWYSEGLLTPRFADAYLVSGKHMVNFIAVNWQKGSDTVNYLYARRRVNEVAEYVARFIDFMYEEAWMQIKDLTIVGHSLGAHISGIAGKKITNGKVDRIVGLDPALPLFKYKDIDDRLAETDASYVEVIHTCAGTLGFSQPLGTASFYPNGGRSQPGCGWDMSGACAHRRAYEFYLESIVTPQFYAIQCDSWENLQQGTCSVVNHAVQMGGEPGIKKARGIYYLQTNSEPVFGQGKSGMLHIILSAKQTNIIKTISSVLFNKTTVDESVAMSREAEKRKLMKKILTNVISKKTVDGTIDMSK